MHVPWQLIIKIATGILIVPFAIAMQRVWPWWENTSLPMKILTGPVVLPLTGLVYVLAGWWGDY